MSSRSRIVLVALVAISIAAVVATMVAQNTQVTICHYPPGNTSNPQTITVAQNAVAAHQKHGDTLGACATSPKK